MDDPILTTVVSALIAAISVMWKKLSADHARLSKRSDDCEQDRQIIHRSLSEVKEDLAVFKACPAEVCPARAGIQRAETFNLQKP
jgi:hypothetical protein